MCCSGQIRVHKDDWPLQKILWIYASGQEAEFHLTTVTYGTRPATFLSVRVFLQLVEDEGHKYPLGVAPLIAGLRSLFSWRISSCKMAKKPGGSLKKLCSGPGLIGKALI